MARGLRRIALCILVLENNNIPHITRQLLPSRLTLEHLSSFFLLRRGDRASSYISITYSGNAIENN